MGDKAKQDDSKEGVEEEVPSAAVEMPAKKQRTEDDSHKAFSKGSRERPPKMQRVETLVALFKEKN